MRFFYFLFLLSLLSISINAQITITPGGTATSIINTFVSNGIVVTNPIINCGSTSYGSYTGNLQAGGIGLSNGGIILTTGSAIGADGPNTSTLFGLEVLGYDYADPQLTSQPGAGTPPPSFDNCRVEFDMTPICSSFNIAFVFGSEEYPEYVTGAYNDGFGIFVSGPNPLGGNYTSYNMARLPNGQLVSIDNVNSNLNNSYYNTNNTGVMQYDGYTDGLTAQLAVIPCSTYHVKIIIADAGDQLWDSGIFLGAGSFACSMPALSITASPTTICAGASTTLTASTAAAGGTYLWSPGGATTQSITVNPLTTTTYTCSYTFSSCSVITATTTVTVATITPSFQPIGPYCSGATIPVFSTSSTNGISGTWSPAINNTASTTYTFTPTAGQCATTQTRTVIITPNITPLFTQVGPYCSGATIPPLPTNSINGITGTWSPVINNTSTTTYTFTPTAGQCATTQTRTVTITPNITPLFTQVGPYCSGATIPVFSTSSTNGITGTWSPAINNTVSTTYTFTPTAGQCATTQTMGITITPNITPLFTQVGPYCSGATIPPLPTNSINGISGTWSPAINNTASTTYTFTPTAGQCGTTQIMSITITPNITPLFTQVGPYCSGATIPPLATNSINGITGTWSPVINNTSTTTYTFTPTAGQCATTQTRTVTITPNITPLFTQVGPYCSGATIPPLATNSTNSITGTWSPAINNTATTTYTFTPTAGQCATITTLSITVTPNVTPIFSAVAAICSGATVPVLPTSSTNTPAITGTWSPAVSNTATTTYTFTPTAGQCATTTTRIITVTPNVTPTFSAVAAICSGATVPVLPTSSTNTPAITGTWSPAVSNTATTTYTFTPTAGQCATTTTLSITVTPNVTPTFSAVAAICSGATAPVLPTSSTNTPVITGTWSPAVSNTATTTYTFTPTAGQCATTTTRSITVTPNVTPTFAAVAAICSGATAPVLPTSSTNTPAITGSWSPAVSNTATTTYTFTPTAGQCATTTTLSITVTPNVTPTFSSVAAICSGATAPVLPTSSTNTPAITGTWSPAVSNTATTTYTFTPTAGQCATTTTLSITVTPNVTPIFSSVAAICSGATAPVLPTSSTNTPAITGTWSPAVSNTATTTYTFTPTAGQCATTTTLSITVTPNVTPTFSSVAAICSGATVPVLPTSSTNTPAITGTWSPAVSNTATTTYTFTPTAGQCATTTTLSITVTPNVTPTFSSVAAICSGATAPVLPTSSTNTPAITGSWSPAVSNTATTTYTFTPTAGQCATTTTLSITVTPNVTPTFSSVAAICSGATAPVLPTSSTNTPAITGTWSPAVSNTATTTYTFTPTAGQCATTTTLSITVTPNVTPIFSSVAAICSGATAPVLPTSSTNTPAITGTWSPAVSNTATTTYTFTPTAGQCATTTTLSITVTPNVTPTFSSVAAICSGATAPVLPTSSTNTPAITGTWSPAVSNTATTTYTFTPTAGQCATTTTLSITVTPNVTPTFAAVAAICSGATAPVLPTSSTNTPAITGSWSPAVSNTATTTYTFTPTAGQCATTTTLSITVTPNVTPTFSSVAAICSGATAPVLPTSSTNTPAITGTWSPAVSNTATTTYTFTPTAGQCATTTTRSITVTPNVTPTFAAVAAICSGATAPVLPTSSTNTPAITGTWSPAVSNTATTTYTFTPTAGQCATTTILSITVTPNVTPTFAAVAAICSGATAPVLPTSSTNTPAITGTWSPAVSNTATTTYTFTPTAGQCATTTILSITVTPNVTPIFSAVAAICSGATVPVLPTSSTNTPAITGTWSPAVSNTATTTYTFTPTAGQCATTQTMNIVISQNTTPTFSQVGPFCSEASISPLPTSSTNGISGTWGPAINNTATTTYTFTPTAGLCATTQTMSITITLNTSPLFTQVGPYCSGSTIPSLLSTSINGITGTWSPALSNTASTTYTFFPTLVAGQCNSTQTMNITITPNITPLFTQVGPYCSGATIPPLPTNSINGITGTWSPVINNTSTTTYTFTPTAVQCATTQTMSITITPNITPLFTQVGPYCSGATIPVFSTSSTNGITGTWSPAINNTVSTTYTFTPTAGQCATTQTMGITITPNITPLFTQVGPYCSGATIPPLATNSTNSITGTWSPAINNTASTTYTFTPTASQCATTQTMSITITPNITPLFTQVSPYCIGATISSLPTSSINGISGTWGPEINNLATTTYTFTPTAGLCATTQTMSISINLPTLPSFTQVGPYCSGATIPPLPTNSINGITGTWSPVINNTATTTYTFIPTAGQCATTQTRTVTITPNITPLFTQVGPYCSGATIPPLATNSTNSITGTWSPAINNTSSTTYTFTPTAGQCGTTQTMSITITPNITPLFTQVGPYCSGATIPPLATNSTNSITGTWSPAINNTASTTYTFTPTASQCATTQTMSITITPNITPLFTQVSPYCIGATISSLPTSSINGISGTWGPEINNSATTTYTFTPTAGLCATTQTMSISINLPTLPSFTQVGPYCSGATIPLLLSTSINGITGTWLPAINNSATTTYTFTPTAGLCATSQTMNIVISQNTTPTFSQVGPFCSEASISPLPTSSTNGISGTWAPAINNTATTTYTFTPTAGLCATTQTMSITITPNASPLFTQVGPFCSGGTISPLPTSSTNGISGIWSPAINNAATTTYTFSPTLITGECASTQTMSIIISPIITSTWSEVVCVSELPFLWNGISYNGAGIYSYYTETAGGCDSTAILNLSISPTPLTSFIPSISLFTESPQLVAFTNTTVGASSYSWDFGDGSYSTDDNPEHVFAENTNGQTITLFAESSEGCIGTYQVSIEFDEGLVYYIPNTFTPDHDEYNQTFRPIFTSGFDPYNYEMLIFNRWGEIIFETYDVTYGWDGTYSFTNSICQDGVYSYKIAFKNPILDERKVVCGNVTLLK